MPQDSHDGLVALITPLFNDYTTGLKETGEVVRENKGYRIGDVPSNIPIIANPEMRKEILNQNLIFNSLQTRGMREKKLVFGIESYQPTREGWHGFIDLIELRRRERAEDKNPLQEGTFRTDYLFNSPVESGGPEIYVEMEEWEAVGKGKFSEIDIPRIHLYDALRGDHPEPGSPYTIFVFDRDKPKITPFNPTTRRNPVETYDTFMRNDLMVLVTGGPGPREELGKTFLSEENGGEGLASINYRDYLSFLAPTSRDLEDFWQKPIGYTVNLGTGRKGIIGFNSGRFLMINDEFYKKFNRHAAELRSANEENRYTESTYEPQKYAA